MVQWQITEYIHSQWNSPTEGVRVPTERPLPKVGKTRAFVNPAKGAVCLPCICMPSLYQGRSWVVLTWSTKNSLHSGRSTLTASGIVQQRVSEFQQRDHYLWVEDPGSEVGMDTRDSRDSTHRKPRMPIDFSGEE